MPAAPTTGPPRGPRERGGTMAPPSGSPPSRGPSPLARGGARDESRTLPPPRVTGIGYFGSFLCSASPIGASTSTARGPEAPLPPGGRPDHQARCAVGLPPEDFAGHSLRAGFVLWRRPNSDPFGGLLGIQTARMSMLLPLGNRSQGSPDWGGRGRLTLRRSRITAARRPGQGRR